MIWPRDLKNITIDDIRLEVKRKSVNLPIPTLLAVFTKDLPYEHEGGSKTQLSQSESLFWATEWSVTVWGIMIFLSDLLYIKIEYSFRKKYLSI